MEPSSVHVLHGKLSAVGSANEQQSNGEGVLSGSGGDRESLRWRPWPCARCSGGLSALDFLGGRVRSGTELLEAEREERTAAQVRGLVDWAAGCPHLAEERLDLPRLSEGSEHRVFVDPANALVYKHTLDGTFGDTYYLVNNRVHQRGCLPQEYLLRMQLWEEVIGLAPKPLGLTKDGKIVSMQQFISGTIPSQEEVDDYLQSIEFVDVKRRCFLWKRTFAKYAVWAGDTRDENFVKTQGGIVPIDIRLWLD